MTNKYSEMEIKQRKINPNKRNVKLSKHREKESVFFIIELELTMKKTILKANNRTIINLNN